MEENQEALTKEAAPHAEAIAEHAVEHKASDPMEHILDSVLFGIDQNGQLVGHPYNEEGEAVVGYAPRMIGPVPLEFTKHMADVAGVALLVFIGAMVVSRAILRGLKENKAPQGKLTNLFEALIVFVRDEVVIPVGGHHVGHYTPLFLTYFMFILLANFVGMIPMAGAATGNIAVTLAMGGSIYVLIWILGIVNQGPINYLIHMVPSGTPWWMWPLMFLLELLGPVIKCFVLCVRLFANMIAGHLIIGNVLALGAFGPGAALPTGIAVMMLALGVPLVLGISILELLVSLIQAYVFTLLAVVFIGAAVHPEH